MRHGEAENDAQKPAGERDQHSFDDELADDVPAPGPHGAAHANLASALENGRQHDIHDADAADKQRDGSDGHHDGVEKLLSALLLGEELCRDDDIEVASIVMRGIEDAADDLRIGGTGIGRGQMQVEAVDLIL